MCSTEPKANKLRRRSKHAQDITGSSRKSSFGQRQRRQLSYWKVGNTMKDLYNNEGFTTWTDDIRRHSTIRAEATSLQGSDVWLSMVKLSEEPTEDSYGESYHNYITSGKSLGWWKSHTLNRHTWKSITVVINVGMSGSRTATALLRKSIVQRAEDRGASALAVCKVTWRSVFVVVEGGTSMCVCFEWFLGASKRDICTHSAMVMCTEWVAW